MIDKYKRNIDYVRISVTDKCNLRCSYCMPSEGIQCMRHEEILEFEEIFRLVKVLSKLGIKKVKLTGGEPLVRKDFIKLVSMIKSIDEIESISITTNGVLLSDMAKELKTAGVDSINISIDTLDGDTFKRITRVDAFERVKKGFEAAISEGFNVKLNCVLTKEFNVDEMLKIAELAKRYPVSVRFIELMPIGCGKEYTGVSNEEVYEKLTKAFGQGKASEKQLGNGPANYVDFEGFKGSIGFISPMSHKFCGDCNRIRITADGRIKLCLHYNDSLDIKSVLRNEPDDAVVLKILEAAIYNKPAAHSFGAEQSENTEQNKMVQIGG